MEAFVYQKKNDIHFSKPKTKICLSLYYNIDNSYLFVNRKKSIDLKLVINFQPQFCLGSISNKFDYGHSEEVSLKGSMYDFSVDYCSIDKSDILNIQKYLMTKNKIK